MAHQPEPVRRFLLHSAVLDRLTGPLCNAVTGREDGSDMLQALERANLFVVPLDDRREWYRYHRLFADVLRARLLSERPWQVPLLHQRASRWYEGRGMSPEAVVHALSALDYDRAAHLMELAVPQIRRTRQDALFLGWLQELPDDVIRRSPVLSVFQAFSLLASGELDGVEPRLQNAERERAAAQARKDSPRSDVDEFQTLPATIAMYRASLAQARGDLVGTTAHAQLAFELAGPGDLLARGAASGFLGLAAWARGDFSTALQTFTQSVASLHAAGNLVDELGGTVVLADLWLVAGRPGKARRIMLGALKLAQALGALGERAEAELHVGLGELDCEAGDLGGARGHLESAAALQGRAPLAESRYRWFVASGLLARAEGDLERAVDLLDQAEPLYLRGFFPEVRPIPAMRARVWIAQGRLLEAGDWAHERAVYVTDEASYMSEFDHLTLVRLLIARHRANPGSGAASAAGALLQRLFDAAQASDRAGSLVEIRLLQALALDVQGHRAQAREVLGQALAEAPEPGGFARLLGSW